MTDFEYMKEALVAEMVTMLIEKTGMDIKSAFDCVYNSETYAKLTMPESGLYFQARDMCILFLPQKLQPAE